MKYLCVYCGSQAGHDPKYAEATRRVGNAIAKRGWGLVYGGGAVGLMGILAEAVLEAGGPVVGVIPRLLSGKEIAKQDCTELILVDTMGQRKAIMAERADAFLALPGGYGTFDELFESLTEAQLSIHSKPIGLLNSFGFFDGLVAWIDHAVREGFLKPKYGLRPEDGRPLLIADAEIDPLLDRLIKDRP